MASGEGWPGSGILGDPYVIYGYEITAPGASAIYIYNTTRHFAIVDCYLHDSSYGVRMEVVENGTIIEFKDGQMQNPSFVDYRIATTMDVPKKIDSIYVEVPQDDGPWGARGIGEHPMVPTIAGLANAICDAVGIRMDGPPFTAEKIFKHLKEKKAK